MVEYNPTKWSWEGTKQFVAETSYDLLDPLYGDGGALLLIISLSLLLMQCLRS